MECEGKSYGISGKPVHFTYMLKPEWFDFRLNYLRSLWQGV